MRALAMAVVAAMAFGCGAPPITDDKTITDPPVVDPGLPPPCEGDCKPPPAELSLWPIDAGRTWRYEITDVDKPRAEKTVTVVGKQTVDGFDGEMTLVKSVTNYPLYVYEERSYQRLDVSGLVWRMLEQDFRDGTQIRSTTWLKQGTNERTGTLKSLSKETTAGWSHTVTVTERIEYFDGAPADLKDKDFRWTVVGIESVTVPAGTFEKALRIRRDRTDKTEPTAREYWLVPGVGKVKETGERTELLLEYSPR